MTTNPYIQDDTGQQDLMESITIEIIQGTGRDVVYVPRQYANIDKIFGEDMGTSFSTSYTIEAYIKTNTGFKGTDIINQFGIEVKDQLTLVIAKKRFKDIVSAAEPTIIRPREGDLIYFPLSKSIFEINFVEHENPFYALGKLHSYELTCEMFSYSMEKITTGNTAINEIYDNAFRTFYNLYVYNLIGATSFYPGQYVSQSGISGSSGGFGQIESWGGETYSPVLINIISGSFSTASTFRALGDTAGVYQGLTASISSIIVDTNRYMSYGTNKTLKGNNEDFEQERFANNVVPFDNANPFSEGNY
jgi:hypothetical protein